MEEQLTSGPTAKARTTVLASKWDAIAHISMAGYPVGCPLEVNPVERNVLGRSDTRTITFCDSGRAVTKSLSAACRAQVKHVPPPRETLFSASMTSGLPLWFGSSSGAMRSCLPLRPRFTS